MKLISSLRSYVGLLLLLFSSPLLAKDQSASQVSVASVTTTSLTYRQRLEAEFTAQKAQLAEDRSELDALLKSYLATVPYATYEEAAAMQAAFMRENFEQYVELEAQEEKVASLGKLLSRAAARENSQLIEQSARAQELEEQERAFTKASKKLLRLEAK
ncbi:MAG: hypothetical protein Q7P63_01420 [Verrucomicrobiota bacterium JB022]|nr:hypothetical protein [Verrucomicrobiota bacterium JB022]